MRSLLVILSLIPVAYLSCKPRGLISSFNQYCDINAQPISLLLSDGENFALCDSAEIFTIDSSIDFHGVQNILLDSSFFNKHIQYFTGRYHATDQAICIVLYYDSGISNNDTVKPSLVRGFGIYSFTGKVFMHKLFTKRKDDFLEVDGLTTNTFAIASKPIMDIARYIIFPKQKKFSIIIIDKNLHGINYNIRGPELLQQKVNEFIAMKKKN